MIGKLLGHTQVQTTARYAHLARDTVKASAARIGDSIDGDLKAVDIVRRPDSRHWPLPPKRYDQARPACDFSA